MVEVDTQVIDLGITSTVLGMSKCLHARYSLSVSDLRESNRYLFMNQVE